MEIKSYVVITDQKFKELRHVIKKDENDIKKIIVKNNEISQNHFHFMFGPCAVESRKMYEETAIFLNKINVKFIRGGAYKLRTSPYAFAGLEREGVKIINEISNKYNLVSITEVPSENEIDFLKNKVDILVVGARNMQNVAMLKLLGKVSNPIILKRGPGSTLLEFLASAELIILSGNPNVILCERGIRSFENYNRYTLDFAGALALKKITNLPVIIDPSHASGRKELIVPLIRASKAAGFSGVLVEVHNDSKNAKSDNMQQINFLDAEKAVSDCAKIKF